MSRSTYYKECPFCGANLDPSEKCDCQTVQKAVRRVSLEMPTKYPIGSESALRNDYSKLYQKDGDK